MKYFANPNLYCCVTNSIREKERELRLSQRKRRNVAALPNNGNKAANSCSSAASSALDWDVRFFNGIHHQGIEAGHGHNDDEDTGIANGMRELELRLQHELEEQE